MNCGYQKSNPICIKPRLIAISTQRLLSRRLIWPNETVKYICWLPPGNGFLEQIFIRKFSALYWSTLFEVRLPGFELWLQIYMYSALQLT